MWLNILQYSLRVCTLLIWGGPTSTSLAVGIDFSPARSSAHSDAFCVCVCCVVGVGALGGILPPSSSLPVTRRHTRIMIP